MSEDPKDKIAAGPWWGSDDWEWHDDIYSALEVGVDAHIERGESAHVGVLDLILTARTEETKKALAWAADDAVEHVINNPEHYGLQKQEKTATD